ncbi:MAG: 2-oxo acid dehydrogenase subunit E2, partial [Gemmatimonadetes bacterium]|nr:2-oxo acid dehydrogenase subunit E2 [Gemmatimonadota bacterium]
MARIEVPMPQMGESIAEGTVSKWLKQVGDEVQRDEPLLEISTDKVDAEIPSPAAGQLAEVLVEEGKTVEVGSILAYVETEKGAAAAPAAKAPPAPAKAEKAEPEAAKAPAAAEPARAEEAPPARGDGRTETAEERLRRRSTPLVRRIAAEHGVDLSEVPGTGQAGRVTKQDILAYVGQRERAPAAAAGAPPARPPAPRPAEAAVTAGQFWQIFYGQVQHPEFPARERDRLEPLERLRKLTADHMVRAKRIAAHVHSFIEVDFTQIDRIRQQNRARWEQQGVKVSYTAFVAWASARVLQEFPRVNATISGDSILYRGEINIGIAVDLDPGLIVPAVRNADELTVVGLAKRINDLAARARERKLKPDEIQGGT